MWLKLSRRPPPFSATENESRKTVTENSLRRLYIHGALLTTRVRESTGEKTEIFKDKRMSSNATIWFLSSAQAALILFMLHGNLKLRQVGSSLGGDNSVIRSREKELFSHKHLWAFVFSKSSRCCMKKILQRRSNVLLIIKFFVWFLKKKIMLILLTNFWPQTKFWCDY